MNNLAQDQEPQEAVERFSPKIARVFVRYLKRRFFPGMFHAVRLMGRANVPDANARPVVVFMNHCSWWDPITGLILNDEVFPGCAGFGPMDAAMLKKYSFMARIGLFPVESDSARGAAAFLRTAREILSAPGRTLGLTPQGEFADVRARPVIFKPGIAHLARDCPNALFLPVAIEQVFWNEKKPELLIHAGLPVDPNEHQGLAIEQWNDLLQERLETAMDELARAAMTRDPHHFETLLLSQTGTSPVYDAWRGVKAKITGKRFSASHGEENE
jgi:1-acyl-sn-glycerol-3-phosphate acyltransferase